MKAFLITIVIIIVLVFCWYIFFYIGWFDGYSNGQRTGDIFKFSKKGLIWKSWEGELYLGGLIKSGESLEVEKFYFSIPERQEKEKTELIKKLNVCSAKRLKCTIVYTQWLKSPIYQDSKYTVEDVIFPDLVPKRE